MNKTITVICAFCFLFFLVAALISDYTRMYVFMFMSLILTVFASLFKEIKTIQAAVCRVQK